MSMPEECPTAPKEARISSGGGRRYRRTTGKLNWFLRAQDKKAALMSMVSVSLSATMSLRRFAKGCSVLPEKRKPANTPQRKSSPLGVRPHPNPEAG